MVSCAGRQVEVLAWIKLVDREMERIDGTDCYTVHTAPIMPCNQRQLVKAQCVSNQSF